MNPLEAAWTRKYAPSCINDVILSEETRKKIESLTSIDNNTILLGPSGIGKSTIAKLLVEKFAPFSNLYINGSNENSIDTVRQKITNFISVKSFDGSKKVIRIEEFDGFSKPAQMALKEIMESDLDDTVFVLTGNEEHKIIDAILSRCIQLRLMPDIKKVFPLIVSVLKQENITIKTEDQLKELKILVRKYFPDIRKTLNELQICCNSGQFVYIERINDVAENIIKMLKDKNNVFDIRQYVVDNVDDFGNDFHALMKDMFGLFVKDKNAKACGVIPEYMYRCASVADQEVNFCGCLFNLV